MRFLLIPPINFSAPLYYTIGTLTQKRFTWRKELLVRTLWKTNKPLLGAWTGTAVLALVSWAVASPGHRPPATPDPDPLIVHEWGTFLSVQGSDGVTLGGMVDSDEVLPSFVEERGIASWQRAQLFSKMETPVTYFYTKRPRDVQVRVDMPKGILTHWFPNVCLYGPKPTAAAAAVGGFLDWCNIHLIPENHPQAKEATSTATLALRDGKVYSGLIASENADQVQLVTGPYSILPVAKSQIAQRRTEKVSVPALKPVGPEQTWGFARQTDAALVRKTTCNAKKELEFQFEKFLFYRGLGTFLPPLEVCARQDEKSGLALTLQNRGPLPLQAIFAVQVQDQAIQFAALDDLPGDAVRAVAGNSIFGLPVPLNTGVPQVKKALASALVAAGLYAKEADAMVNTWERSYFRTEGLRVLYVLPRPTVDELIPIRIRPAPSSLVRVMVGRLEVLTPDREQQIKKFLTDLGARESRTRAAASAGLARLGRLGEPALRRIMAATKDPEILARARSLLDQMAARK
jgi:hypothetical protein